MVLRDPDPVMAQSAVVAELDRRAQQLLDDPAFTHWAQNIADALAGHDFLVGRLREWALLHTVASGGSWSAEAVVTVSDWCQRKAVEVVDSRALLTMLAERGRTRRVRNAAMRRLTEPGLQIE